MAKKVTIRQTGKLEKATPAPGIMEKQRPKQPSASTASKYAAREGSFAIIG